MTRMIDLIGQKFGRLTVVSRSENAKYGNTRWLCKCDCENMKVVSASDLKGKKTKSCGCLNKELIIKRNMKHGDSIRGSETREHRVWAGMKERCLNPMNQRFMDYGGRKISVCKEWRDSYETFLKDMGRCPKGFSIERKNVNGNYEPDNCIWASASTQAFNQRRLKRNTSGVCGVVFDKKSNKYGARINHNKNRYQLGFFNTLEQAAEARHRAELLYYGVTK